MSAREAEIRRLMARGLDLYGLGQVREATECWRRVLSIDPAHAEARDYLQAAGGELPPAPADPGAADDPALEEAAAMLREGRLAEGMEVLETLAEAEPGRLEVQAWVELGRALLLPVYREHVGSAGRIPRVRVRAEEVLRYNLPATTGFLLSLVDGRTSVDELLALSGMDPFEVLRGLKNLLDAGIVEAAA